MPIDSVTLLRLDESMTTLWSTGFCQFVGSTHHRPGTWQAQIPTQHFEWLSDTAERLGTETLRKRKAAQSLIMTGDGAEWRIEQHEVIQDAQFWLVASIIDGIASRTYWAPLDRTGEQDFYRYSLQPQVHLEYGQARAKGNAVDGGVLVIAGAIASTAETPSLQSHYHQLRRKMIDRQQLEYYNGRLILTEHVFFDSPSKAACILTGSITNGRNAWKTITGESIGSLPGYNDYT
jgi:hypothetical protein